MCICDTAGFPSGAVLIGGSAHLLLRLPENVVRCKSNFVALS